MLSTIKNFLRQLLIITPISILTGAVIALFLYLLNLAIHYRFTHPWLLFLLPLAGIAIYFIYKLYASNSEKGNNLVIEEIHQPAAGVPKRMAPVILLTTVITHLFGGSAGREGTAVQIGGSIAAMFGKWFKLNTDDTKLVLIAGIAAGFGAVFGTPLTGAIFAIEVLTLGRIKYNALLPALAASYLADITVSVIGIHHTVYRIEELSNEQLPITAYIPTDVMLIVKVIAAAAAFGLASLLFAEMTHKVKAVSTKLIPIKWVIPVIGGLIIIALTYLNGKQDYLSLGVDAAYPGAITIPSAFHAAGADTWSWLWKTIYTAVTLGTGFKGGEVTPLFYIGATLGNTIATLLHAPISLFAALGFIAVFAGATKTPVACTLMGAELFGGHYLVLFALACFIAYFCSGHTGIYSAQLLPETLLRPGNPSEPISERNNRISLIKRYTHIKIDKYRFGRSQ